MLVKEGNQKRRNYGKTARYSFCLGKNKKEYDAEKKRLEIGKWIWQMAYDLTRMKERCKPKLNESTVMIDFLQELISWTITHNLPNTALQILNGKKITHLQFFRLLNLACIWASYDLRNKEN